MGHEAPPALDVGEIGRMAREPTSEPFRGDKMKFGIAIAICIVLIAYGLVTVVTSQGFFINVLGAGMTGCGGAAAYLLIVERRSMRRLRREHL